MSAKKVAIAGYGVEGKVNYAYWRNLGHEVTIVDERELSPYDLPYGAAAMLGKNVFKKLSDFDLVIRTASLRPDKIKTKGKIWSATNEFFDKCPAPIIGVTGTKGKGTTSSLIASILRAAGKTVHLLGNIGTPALEVLPTIKADDIVVFELSSFQLWDIEKSPHVAVVLMIEPEHLDIHKDMQEYVRAKSNICRFQTPADACVYHPTNSYSRQIAFTHHKTSNCEYCKDGDFAHRYGIPDDNEVYVKDGFFCVGERKICPTSSLQLVGEHNLENACAAISAVSEIISPIPDNAVEEGLRNFQGLPHRIQFVREIDGVKYYNDSYSSAAGATLAALRSFEQPEVLICGGYDRGLKYDRLAYEMATIKNLKHIVLMGQTSQAIAKSLKKEGVGNFTICKTADFAEVVKTASAHATSGDVVLFSPGCASFDMFKNFTDRGEKFIEIVEAM